MRGPSLQKSALVSAALHASALLLAVVVIRQPNRIFVPSPYVVSLVAPSVAASRSAVPEVAAPAAAKSVSDKAPAVEPDLSSGKKKDHALDDTRLADQLAAMEAKRKLKKKIELRETVLGVSKSQPGTIREARQQPVAAGGPQHGSLFDSYYAKITNEIRSEWIYPDTGEKNLEAVIAVMIARDGSLSVQGIEKSSGSALFDRSALRALTKASPVSPPPYEMAVGIRFFP